jgi:hypothetical protein
MQFERLTLQLWRVIIKHNEEGTVTKLPPKFIRPCGLCWYGPCMCSVVTDAKHKATPPGKDDHIWTKTAAEVDAATAEFRREMQAISAWRNK